jgi:serine/threonine kinase 38
MDQRLSLDKLLKTKKISQRTYDKVKIAKEYIENKYNLKSLFSNKLKNIMQNIQNLNIDEELKMKIIKEINDIQIQKIRKNREKQTIREYESLKIIGRGAFGEVHVCREIKTGKIYAVKKIKKDVLLKKNQVIHIRSEQQIMSKIKSPWIVDLKASFQEDDFLYLVMEFCQGGDFMNLLIKKDILTEAEAKFYIAELILAVDSIHKLNCIHRDIKPDNILIDKNGHIKLSDFGLAKISENFGKNQPNLNNNKFTNNKKRPTHQKIFSCVGTAYYVAPEVLKKTGYSEDIDWWSVGVIFFESLVGYAPFCSEETKDVCYKVINWKKFLKIPDDIIISKEAEDLISKMINNSDERLGKNGVEEIKAHPFFKDVDWDNIRNTKAPFIPDIKNDYDTKYFEEEFQYEEEFYPPKKKFKKRKDIEFLGYTYKEEDDINNNGNNINNNYYDEEDEINHLYDDILNKYQISNKQKKENGIEQLKDTNNINNINPIQLISYNNMNKKKSSNGNINGGNQGNNVIWTKNKNMVYVKNQTKLKYSPKNNNKKENKICGSPLYNKIKEQNQIQQKPLKMIKILDKKNNVNINDIHLAKSANNSKNKYPKIKLGLNNNSNSKNNKMRLSPIINNKKLKISLSNSQKRLIGGKINNTKKIKIQEFKNEGSLKNIKDNNNNFSPNHVFKV